MFQNIAKDFDENQESYEDVELNRKEKIKEVLKKCFNKQMILLYIISFLLSIVSFNINTDLAPFGIAIIVAILSNCIPIGIVSILVVIGTSIFQGGISTLNLLLTLLLIFVSILIKAPKYQEDSNEKRKLGRRLFICTLIVQIIQLFFREVLIYDIIFAIIYSVSVYIFYKIFSNSISAVTTIGEKRAYTIEELMGASLILAIAVCAVGNFYVFGLSVRNILCILIVLIMGWKNGILVGATAGITIGSVVGIIQNAEPVIIATYALSGMVAGIFNKLGKIGVIIGFILGNILISYVTNGNTTSLIALIYISCVFVSFLLIVPYSTCISPDEAIVSYSSGFSSFCLTHCIPSGIVKIAFTSPVSSVPVFVTFNVYLTISLFNKTLFSSTLLVNVASNLAPVPVATPSFADSSASETVPSGLLLLKYTA